MRAVRMLWTLVFVLFVTQAGAAHGSELLTDLAQVYYEDFIGENAFPLTPELDPLGFGGMDAYRQGDPLPLAPTVTGGEMLIQITEPADSEVLLQSSGGAVPVEFAEGTAVGVRARYDGFEVVATGQFLAAGVTLLDSVLGNGASGYLLDFQDAGLRVVVSNLSPIGLDGYDDVFLTPSAEAAIRAGNAFEVELRFDQTARTAQAALTVGGEVFQTDATTSATFTAMQPDLALVLNALTNNGPPIATIASDVQDFAIFAPEPGPGGAALAAAAALAAMRRRGARAAQATGGRR